MGLGLGLGLGRVLLQLIEQRGRRTALLLELGEEVQLEAGAGALGAQLVAHRAIRDHVPEGALLHQAGQLRRRAHHARHLGLALDVTHDLRPQGVVHGHHHDAGLVARLRSQHPLRAVLAVETQEAQALRCARHELQLPQRRGDGVDARADLGVGLPLERPDAPVRPEAGAEARRVGPPREAAAREHVVHVAVVCVGAAGDERMRREGVAQHRSVAGRRSHHVSEPDAGIEPRDSVGLVLGHVFCRNRRRKCVPRAACRRRLRQE